MMSPALNAVIPVICIALAGLTCLLAEAFREKGERLPIGGLATIGLIGAAVASILLWGRHAESFGVVVADDFGLFVGLVLIGIGILTVAFSPSLIDRDKLPQGEYYALMLFAIAGMMLMAIATDLVIIFLALEVFSLSIYVLTGLRRDSYASTEAAFKYFLLGGFSSAFFLYGIAFTYGIVHSTRLYRSTCGRRMPTRGRPPS
jgi:NADH-quinone oxidoreductase subunit N